MMISPLGAMFSCPGVYEALASLASSVALWAQARSHREEDPMADLTERVRHPLKWRVKHPWRAVALAVRRRA